MLRNLQPGKQAIFPALKPRHEMIRETMKTMWSFWRKLDRQEDHTGTELHCIIYKEHFPGPCHLLFCLSFSGAETPQGLTFGRTRDVEKPLQSVSADIVDSRAIWLPDRGYCCRKWLVYFAFNQRTQNMKCREQFCLNCLSLAKDEQREEQHMT